MRALLEAGSASRGDLLAAGRGAFPWGDGGSVQAAGSRGQRPRVNGAGQGRKGENDAVCLAHTHSLPEDRAALLGQRKVKILKAFKLFSFHLGSRLLSRSAAEWPEQRAGPLAFKGELRAGRESWLVWVLLFCSITRNGFMVLYGTAPKLG